MTDPVADFLTRIRNAIQASHEVVEIPSSKLKRELARILQEEGYISSFSVEPPTSRRASELLEIQLRYAESRQPVISGLRRVSRPGRRTYAASTSIPRVQGGMGTTIVSTSRGIMTGHQARREGIGGELMAEVW